MKLAFLGVGNMAGAVISANGGKTLSWQDIFLYDKFGGKCSDFEKYGATIVRSVSESIKKADAIFIAVKPQDYPDLLEEIKLSEGYADKLYISIGAGIESESIQKALECKKVVRALPNTPMIIKKGVSAVCKTKSVSEEDYRFVISLFENAGSVIEIEENEMNRIIGVTSSSPAYVFEFIDAIIKGAEKQGLDGNSLLTTVCDVIAGSALLLKSSGKSAADMISMVASKGGTTECALKVLHDARFSETVSEAMQACTKRADELGKNNLIN